MVQESRTSQQLLHSQFNYERLIILLLCTVQSVSSNCVSNISFSVSKIYLLIFIGKSSHADVFCKKYFIKKNAKYIGKHVYKSFFFNKLAGLMRIVI